MYVLEGLHRWNLKRSQQSEGVDFCSYDTPLNTFISTTSQKLLGHSVIHVPPLSAPYTGEHKFVIATNKSLNFNHGGPFSYTFLNHYFPIPHFTNFLCVFVIIILCIFVCPIDSTIKKIVRTMVYPIWLLVMSSLTRRVNHIF